MRPRHLVVAVLFLASASSAQVPDDRGLAYRELEGPLRALREEVEARRGELLRTSGALDKLVAAAERISAVARDASIDRALDELEEARKLVEAEPSLPRPVPDVLEAMRRLLERESFGVPADLLRGRAFAVLLPLERHLAARALMAHGEVARLKSLESSFFNLSTGLRGSADGALGVLAATRAKAVK